jgi:hypothetical protein
LFAVLFAVLFAGNKILQTEATVQFDIADDIQRKTNRDYQH